MRPTLIANPFSSRVTEQRVREVEQRIGAVETFLTERKGHATELAREAQGDSVFAFGGDGLVNEVLNGLAGDRPLGIVAGGHTNVFARALGCPSDPVKATRARRISLGRANGRRFGFASGIGVDSHAVRELDTIKRWQDGKRPGDLAYARVVTKRLWAGHEPLLEIDGHGRASLVFVSNDAVYSYAGPMPLRFSPEARFELGLDVCAPRRAARGAAAWYVARLVAQRGLARVGDVIALHDVDSVRVTCEVPLPLQVDGEDLGDVTEVVFEAERAAISVLVS